MRLIDANEFKKRIDHYPAEIRDIAKKELRYVHTIDAEPVRHGHWNIAEGMPTQCSRCGYYVKQKTYKYCPYCGARMEIEENERKRANETNTTI